MALSSWLNPRRRTRLRRPVQAHLFDVFRHGIGYQARQRAPAQSGSSNLCRGHGHMDVLEEVNVRRAQHQLALRRLLAKSLADGLPGSKAFGQSLRHLGEAVPRPVTHDEFRFAQQRLRLFPLGDLQKRVNADEEEEAIALTQGALEAAHRVNRIVDPGMVVVHVAVHGFDALAGARHLNHLARMVPGWGVRGLQPRWKERLLAQRSHGQHGVAVLKRGQRLAGAQGRQVSWNKMNLFEVEALLGRPGQREMTFVHGIEGTAEEGDIHEQRSVLSSSFALNEEGCKWGFAPSRPPAMPRLVWYLASAISHFLRRLKSHEPDARGEALCPHDLNWREHLCPAGAILQAAGSSPA